MIFTGTLILTLSGFLARILGFYNRIFLSNLIGAKELGIYQLIFPIYMLCFSLCCHGFETGISNLTSRFFAKGQKKNAHHLVRLGCLFSFCLSILLMFALFEGADYLSTFILKEASAAPSLKIAALSLPFVSIKACLHGYCIGFSRSSCTRQSARL
ncbi:MAG: MATE family efflux transporter [Anaerobutyricum soehngenii]